MQVQEETDPGEQNKNIYKPHLPLLGSVHLRLAHALVLLATDCCSTETSPVQYISRALSACEDGLEAVRSSASSDPPLAAELMFYRGKLHHIAWKPRSQALGVKPGNEAKNTNHRNVHSKS